MNTVIRHSLDLALRLIDTTTGQEIDEQEITLWRNGAATLPMRKGNGSLVLIGQGREDFTLRVQVKGYEPYTTLVEYAKLDPHLPLLDLHMIPGERYVSRFPCFLLAGQLAGITALDAVKANGNHCAVRAFDPKNRLMTLFNYHKLAMDRIHYGILNASGDQYIPFCIQKQINPETYQIDRVLPIEAGENAPVAAQVFGMVLPDGGYRLRVQNDSTDAKWIVRWQIGETQHFKRIDFNHPEGVTLS